LQLGGRDMRKIFASVLQRRHYVAVRNMFRLYENPSQMLRQYLTGSGVYPYIVRVKTPMSWIELNLYSPHDLLTVNEIFCRDDYHADSSDKVVVDFGSNIGISAAYFLTRGPETFTYLFEPLPANIARLKENLRRFAGRFKLEEVAVGPHDGEVNFGWEETGRYGGVDAAFERTIRVTCRNSNSILKEIIAIHGHIDILKVDIETLEEVVIRSLPETLVDNINKLYVEYPFHDNPLAATHTHRQYGSIAQFTRRPQP